MYKLFHIKTLRLSEPLSSWAEVKEKPVRKTTHSYGNNSICIKSISERLDCDQTV